MYVHLASSLPHPNHGLQYGAQRKGSRGSRAWGPRGRDTVVPRVEAKWCPSGGIGAAGRRGVGSDLLRDSFVPQGLGLLTSPCSCGESGPVGLHLAPPTLGAVSSSGREGREEGLGAGRGWGSTFQERTRRVGTRNPALSRGGAKHTCTLLFSDHLSSVRPGIYSHPPSGPVGEEGDPPPQPGRRFYPATPLTCSFHSSPGWWR